MKQIENNVLFGNFNEFWTHVWITDESLTYVFSYFTIPNLDN
jgi:hypothetical protein